MKITNEWLSENNACTDGRDWWQAQKENDPIKVLRKLMRLKKWDWFRWLAPRLMTHPQKVEWAIFCAEQVIDIFEKKYPENLVPRKSIEAAKSWLENPCKETRKAASASASATYDAAASAASAAAAAAAAASAASAAATYAASDAYASAAASAASASASATYDAAASASEKRRIVCAKKAIEILKL